MVKEINPKNSGNVPSTVPGQIRKISKANVFTGITFGFSHYLLSQKKESGQYSSGVSV